MVKPTPELTALYLEFVEKLWCDYANGAIDEATMDRHRADIPALNALAHAAASLKHGGHGGGPRLFWARRHEVFVDVAGEPVPFPEVVWSGDQYDIREGAGQYISNHRDYLETASEMMEADLANGQTQSYVARCRAVLDLIDARTSVAKWKTRA